MCTSRLSVPDPSALHLDRFTLERQLTGDCGTHVPAFRNEERNNNDISRNLIFEDSIKERLLVQKSRDDPVVAALLPEPAY